ncbi:MAG TPA: hypothetical protein VNE42_03015, partial [Acidimicrobiales bacterium]|nr:hypothetical protein [Acidimicrobiales bacterium]
SAESRLNENLDAARELAAFQNAQRTREEWLDKHPDEVSWAKELGVQLASRTMEQKRSQTKERGARSIHNTTEHDVASCSAQQKFVEAEHPPTAVPSRDAREARDRQARRPDPQYMSEPEQPIDLSLQIRRPELEV